MDARLYLEQEVQDAPMGFFLQESEHGLSIRAANLPTREGIKGWAVAARESLLNWAVGTDEVLFIDLSHWNQPPDFAALYADGVRAVVFRVSFGASGVDSKFAEWWPLALAAGMVILVYHFGRQNVSGQVQAAHLWGLIQPLVEALGTVPPIVYDCETQDGAPPAQIWGVVWDFCTYLINQGATWSKLILYTSPGFANAYMQPVPAWEGQILKWIAHWLNGLPTMPLGMSNLWAQQRGICNDHAWVPCLTGIAPDVDIDYYFGTEAELRAWAEQVVPPPTIPPPTSYTRAKVINAAGVSVRAKPNASATKGGSLALNTVVNVHLVESKPNGEIWLLMDGPDLIGGWSCMYYPAYTNPKLMEWV